MIPNLTYAHAQALISERLQAAARHTPPGPQQDVGRPVSRRLPLPHLLNTSIGESQFGRRGVTPRARRRGRWLLRPR
jgi:hypothetical protein